MHYQAQLVRVIDGDTVVLHVNLGLGVWLHDRHCRLARINAPEMSTPQGPPAREYLIGLLGSLPIEVDCKKCDDYGRLLVEVYAKGLNANDGMVSAGQAVTVKYLESEEPSYGNGSE